MRQKFKDILLKSTNSESFQLVEEIQSLWSGYGTISRYHLRGAAFKSVIVKHVKFPNIINHPRGWDSDISHQRKLKSYQVETNWYKNFSEKTDVYCRIPKCYGITSFEDEVFMILEDLDSVGFEVRLTEVNWDSFTTCLKWMANFHAKFMAVSPISLWEIGTYWHLATRPDELKILDDKALRENAAKINYILNSANYQTLVHGDAKLANFCFSSDGLKVAAVDFQYVGRGCGMKDLVYFIGSCFREADCLKHEFKILEVYFSELNLALSRCNPAIDKYEVELEWRSLFDIAWADFHRFMKGWSPGHWKVNSYSEILTQSVLKKIANVLDEINLRELQCLAEATAIKAGALIEAEKQKGFTVKYKSSGISQASQVVTGIDETVQDYILDALSVSINKYDFGVLTEEKSDDGSRFEKEYFWCIDPLDGTLPFIEGRSGYSVSIALVSRKGYSVLGVVFDPVNNNLYSAVKGLGATINGVELKKTNNCLNSYFTLVVDQSYFESKERMAITKKFEDKYGEVHVVNIGGAVINALWVISNQYSCYYKAVKENKGGGSIWDFAASSCIAIESGIKVSDASGRMLYLNNNETTFMNKVGVWFR